MFAWRTPSNATEQEMLRWRPLLTFLRESLPATALRFWYFQLEHSMFVVRFPNIALKHLTELPSETTVDASIH
jgi:hypothetical protein